MIARRMSDEGMKLAALGFETLAILACSEGTRSTRRCGRCRLDADKSPNIHDDGPDAGLLQVIVLHHAAEVVRGGLA